LKLRFLIFAAKENKEKDRLERERIEKEEAKAQDIEELVHLLGESMRPVATTLVSKGMTKDLLLENYQADPSSSMWMRKYGVTSEADRTVIFETLANPNKTGNIFRIEINLISATGL
jgi:hypothetical protein